MEPYCDNPILYGYTGLLAYSLWEQFNAIIKENESKQEPEIYRPPKRKNSSKKYVPPREKSKRKRNAEEENKEVLVVGMSSLEPCWKKKLIFFNLNVGLDEQFMEQ